MLTFTGKNGLDPIGGVCWVRVVKYDVLDAKTVVS